jgi:hypothetical protein
MARPESSPSAVDANLSVVGWILRIGVAGCFIGHGAFGVIAKAAWVPYFGVTGIHADTAWRLMPVVGAMDIVIGILALAWPCRALFAWGIVWAAWTALLRPLSGEPFWETFERAGNYGVPLACLVLYGVRGTWLTRVSISQAVIEFTPRVRQRLLWTLRLTTFFLLIGHACLGLVVHKAGLTQHYLAVWSDAPASTVTWIGAFELVLAAALLLRPTPGLLLGICLWKIATESLFLVAGAPVWELIERFGSYTAPLALAFLLTKTHFVASNRFSSADHLPSLS